MRVFQAPPNAHPLLAALSQLVAAAPRIVPLPGEANAAAALAADLAAGPGGDERVIARTRICAHAPTLLDAARAAVPGIDFRAALYYPPGGGMGWHTNADAPGFRAYVVRAPGSSGFGTREAFVPDRDGWTNLFEVGADSWHYVKAEAERWSLGMILPPELARVIIDRCCD